MRVVIDTNVWISGLLWRGAPWRILRLVEQGEIEVCIAPPMLAELEEVLSAERLRPRLEQLGFSPSDLVIYALHLSTMFEVPEPSGSSLSPVIAGDPDDDVFVLCAEVSGASYLVSGDRHLLDMVQYRELDIMSPAAFLERTFPGEG
jgi:uncharacterized protein